MKLKVRKMQELLQSDRIKFEEIWVLNKTSVTEDKPGSVLFSVKVDGDEQSIIIPSTWIPINLTDQVPADVLASSPNFRKVINSGRLTMHYAEDCIRFMQDKDAQAELNRIKEVDNQLQNIINTGSYDEGIKIDVVSQNENAAPLNKENRISSIASARELGDPKALGVLMLVYQVMNDSEITAVAKMNTLRTNRPKMNKIDLKYIMETSEDVNIQNWAKKELYSSGKDVNEETTTSESA